MTELEVGDLVLCTVERITGTIVFVEIQGGQKGSITFSEVSPGRIRNIRDFVVPKKKIVCKVLRISLNGNIELTLRRVTQKEQKEVLEKLKQEKSSTSIIKTVLKDKSEKVIKEILKTSSLYDFLQEAKEDSKKLEKVVGKEECKKIVEILKAQKQKQATVKKIFGLTTKDPEGILKIKKLLSKFKEAEIKYVSAGKYSIQATTTELKQSDKQIREILETITIEAKKQKIDFSENPSDGKK
jgi:translation initiation factor 2 alpha subunit (eIF-2alpha)